MILGIQILGLLFGLFMLFFTYTKMKRKEFTATESAFWFSAWLGFILIALVPQITDPFVKTLDFARNMDFFIILGFMFLLGSMFYIYSLVRGLQKKIEDLVRKLALK